MYKDNKYGFKTRKITVLKAEKKDAKDISKFYMEFSLKRQKEIAKNWEKIIENRGDDLYKEVAMIVRDKCKKAIGLVETESKDGKEIVISIWIPNPIKRKNYLDEIIDDMIEWCEDHSNYIFIESIRLVTEVTSFGVKQEELEHDIWCCAS